MQSISHLVSLSPEADVLEIFTFPITMNPKSKDALRRMSKLASTSHHTASINPNREAKSRSVFECQVFRSNLCTTVERDRRFGGIVFRDAFCRKAFRKG